MDEFLECKAAYPVGYVEIDIAVTIFLDKGIGKLKELRKAKSLNAVDNVLNVVDDGLSVTDDVANAADDVMKPYDRSMLRTAQRYSGILQKRKL